jgi:hypothetical protein
MAAAGWEKVLIFSHSFLLFQFLPVSTSSNDDELGLTEGKINKTDAKLIEPSKSTRYKVLGIR